MLQFRRSRLLPRPAYKTHSSTLQSLVFWICSSAMFMQLKAQVCSVFADSDVVVSVGGEAESVAEGVSVTRVGADQVIKVYDDPGDGAVAEVSS